jgi:hypothetical protein
MGYMHIGVLFCLYGATAIIWCIDAFWDAECEWWEPIVYPLVYPLYMLFRHRRILVVVFVSLALVIASCRAAYAQAALAPVENYVVNRAIGGIIANRIAISRGVAANDATWLATAANDPVFKATMAGVSSTMTAANVASTALGVGLTVAGAPLWLTVAAGLGVVGVGAYLARDIASGTEFKIAADAAGNRIHITNQVTPAPAYASPGSVTGVYGIDLALANGANIYRSPASCFTGMSCYALPELPSTRPMMWQNSELGQTEYVLVANDVQTLSKFYVMMQKPGFNLPAGVTYTYESSGGGFVYSDNGTPSWYVWIHEARTGGDAVGLPSYDKTFFVYPTGAVFAPGAVPGVYKNLDDAYAAVGPKLKTAPVSSPLLASMADAAWRNAASQPGYQGLPYSVTNPVTSADVATWTAANPSAAPQLDDLLRPAQNPTTDPAGVPISPTVQVSNPDPAPGGNSNVNVVNTPNVNVINKVTVDFGTDPNVAAPSLETTPTAQMILTPLLNLFPTLKNFVVPSHSSECPKPTMHLFGKELVLDGHCTLLESVRPTLYQVMAAVWVIVALFIVLAA